MQEVNDGIAAMAIARVTGREVDRNVAVGRIALQVAFEKFAVDLDAFDGARRGYGRRLAGGRALRAKKAQAATACKEKHGGPSEGFHGRGW
jgi:hypothetical protein